MCPKDAPNTQGVYKAIIDFSSSLWEVTTCGDDKATERYSFRMINRKKQKIIV